MSRIGKQPIPVPAGVEVTIDDKLVVDNDGDHGADEKSGKIKLAAGAHKILLGYYQAGGDRRKGDHQPREIHLG